MAQVTKMLYKEYASEEYVLTEEPFYKPVADEVELFEAAYRQKLPVLLKGPTGCGKTRFVEYMAWHLGEKLVRMASDKENDIKEALGV